MCFSAIHTLCWNCISTPRRNWLGQQTDGLTVCISTYRPLCLPPFYSSILLPDRKHAQTPVGTYQPITTGGLGATGEGDPWIRMECKGSARTLLPWAANVTGANTEELGHGDTIILYNIIYILDVDDSTIVHGIVVSIILYHIIMIIIYYLYIFILYQSFSLQRHLRIHWTVDCVDFHQHMRWWLLMNPNIKTCVKITVSVKNKSGRRTSITYRII